jgi:hypothetical protein
MVIVPRLRIAPRDKSLRAWVQVGAVHKGAVVAGAWTAAVAIDRTYMRGFLGGSGSVISLSAYIVLSTALSWSIAFAFFYHRQSVDRARSEHDVQQARALQQSFLPAAFPTSGRLDVFATNIPSRTASCGSRSST